MPKSASLTFLVVVLYAGAASAESPDEIAESAVVVDPRIDTLESRQNAELERSKSAFTFPPLQVGYAFLPLAVETRLGPQRHRLKVAQKIPWFGLAKATNAVPAAKAAVIEVEKSRRELDVASEVRVLGWKLWNIKESIRVLDAHRRLLNRLQATAIVLLEVGRTKKSDISQISLAIAKLENAIRSRKVEYDEMETRFDAFGVEPPTEWPMPNRSSIDASISSKHPDLERLDALDGVARANQNRLKKTNKPSLMLGAEYIEIGEGTVPAPDAGRDAFAISLAVSFPIWSRPNVQSARALDAEIVSRKFERIELLRKLEAAAHVKVLRINDLNDTIAFIRDTSLPLAQTVQQDLISDYETSSGSITDVIRAVDELHKLDLLLAQNISEREIEIAKLSRLTARRIQETQ